jgi:hypothetical protein
VQNGKKERISFPLRLPKLLRDQARLLAIQDGVSLNHFISLAVAEKVTRLETAPVLKASPSIEQDPSGLISQAIK